jgi:OTU domain-containing protein 5
MNWISNEFIQEKNRDFFSQFVDEDFDEYIKRKRCDGVFGNHLEIHACVEIYNRPVEIYTCDESTCSKSSSLIY